MAFTRNLIAAIAAAGTICVTSPAWAQDTGDSVWSKDRWQIRGRIIGVAPDDDVPVNIGGEGDFSDAVVPELDISYFFTKNIAVELILATSQHAAHYNGDTDLGEAMILPPTLTLQYHPLRDESNFQERLS